MYKVLLGLSLIFCGYTQMQAQEKREFEDLLLLFVDENYEKCMAKAEKYTLKDDTRREPMPYLYISMCMYEMSLYDDAEELYPRALKDALSYAYKYVRKDKNMLYFDDHVDYFASLRKAAALAAENELAEEKYSRAKYYYKALTKIDPKDPSAWYMLAYAELKASMRKEASEHFRLAMELFNGLSSAYTLTKEQQDLMIYGMVNYANFLVQEGRSDSAYSTLESGRRLFEENKDFMAVYNSIIK